MKNHFSTIRHLITSESGNVMVMVAIFILTIFAIAGSAVDFGRGQLLQIKQQQSTDIAALAAATILPKDYSNEDEEEIRTNTADRYYNLNFPESYLGVNRTTPYFDFDKSSGNIEVSNRNALNTNFVVTAGTDSIHTASRTTVNIPDPNFPDFDVVMVVDESGSTRQAVPNTTVSRIETEKDAIKQMLSVLFPENQPYNYNLRFGVVGYSGPIIHAFGLTSNKIRAQQYVDALDWYYQNYDHWGLEAGYNMLSGNWSAFVPPTHCTLHQTGPQPRCIPEQNTAVPPAETERNDGKKLSPTKYLVLLTDGELMREPPPCDVAGAVPCPNYPIFLEECTRIKQAGITIFTINFVSLSVNDVEPMRSCASSDDKYFFAPDGPTLRTILTGIASQIRSVRITN